MNNIKYRDIKTGEMLVVGVTQRKGAILEPNLPRFSARSLGRKYHSKMTADRRLHAAGFIRAAKWKAPASTPSTY